MSALRPFSYLLLVLALIANGLVADRMAMAQSQTVATAAADASASEGHAGCHEAGPATPAAVDPAPDGTPMKCCDGAGCTCACIQHAPALLLSLALPALERFSPPPVLGMRVTWPTAPTAPQLRPPIA